MPSYLSPGVYVEEVSSGSKPIEGVGTSTAAFIGYAEKGPANEPTLVTSPTQFKKMFGGYLADKYMAHAVDAFFSEGGTACYIVRVLADDAKWSTITIDSKLTVTASSPGKWGDRLSVKVSDPTDSSLGVDRFNLEVFCEGKQVEVFTNAKLETIKKEVDGKSGYIVVQRLGGATDKPTAGEYALTSGDDGTDPSGLFVNNAHLDKGIFTLDKIDNVNIVAMPDKNGDRPAILGALAYCEKRKDCIFLADAALGTNHAGIKTFKQGAAGENALNSSYGALYYPWVKVANPAGGHPISIPPSGAIAGTYAYTDSKRGVHKAPAGINEGYLNSVVGVTSVVTMGEHDELNPLGINVIRFFQGSGICVWGARTLSADPEWRYINVRRLFMFVEESIDEGSQWVVFEPNNQTLWGSVRRNITAFLTRVWRDGALFGTTPDEAFYVKVNEENNPPEVRDAGQLIIEVGIAPVKPAEFVVIRISQKTQPAA